MALFGLKPDAPTPPNPLVTSAAQTGTNVSTAVANSFLNNVNQNTPAGSITFDPTSTYNWADPTTGVNYSIPRWTMTQALNPTGQNIFNLDQQTQTNLGQMSAQQSGALKGLLGSPFNPTGGVLSNPDQYLAANPDVMAAYQRGQGTYPGETAQQYAQQHYGLFGQYEGRQGGITQAPTAGNAALNFNAQAYLQAYPDVAQAYAAGHQPGETPEQFALRHYQESGAGEGRTAGNMQAQGNIADVGSQQYGLGAFGNAGDITRSYGPADNFSADRARVEQSLFQRMDPQLQLDRSNLQARLADQGIQYGSPAYQSAMDQFERQVTDTRLGITQTAGQEQQRMMDMAAQQAGFQNAAQQQAYSQMLQSGQFYNQAQQQAFAQASGRNTAANAALAQNYAQAQGQFNAQNAARQQYLSEQYAQRNQPINEITSLLSGSQVQMPQQLSTPTNQIPTTDIAGLLNNRFTQDMSIYNAQNQNFNQLMGGIFGMMGGMARGGSYLSDVREKENIDRVGTIFAAAPEDDTPSKLPIYQYSYKDDPASTRHIGPMAQDVEKIDPKAVTTKGGRKYISNTRMSSILRAV